MSDIERDLVGLLRESAPDHGQRTQLSLRAANQRLVDLGHADCQPDVVLRVLKTLERGERTKAGWWIKCVQLDLEAKGVLKRSEKPVRLYKA